MCGISAPTNVGRSDTTHFYIAFRCFCIAFLIAGALPPSPRTRRGQRVPLKSGPSVRQCFRETSVKGCSAKIFYENFKPLTFVSAPIFVCIDCIPNSKHIKLYLEISQANQNHSHESNHHFQHHQDLIVYVFL